MSRANSKETCHHGGFFSIHAALINPRSPEGSLSCRSNLTLPDPALSGHQQNLSALRGDEAGPGYSGSSDVIARGRVHPVATAVVCARVSAARRRVRRGAHRDVGGPDGGWVEQNAPRDSCCRDCMLGAKAGRQAPCDTTDDDAGDPDSDLTLRVVTTTGRTYTPSPTDTLSHTDKHTHTHAHTLPKEVC